MSRSYEIALFGDMDQGHIMEIAEALDPEQHYIQGRLGRESTIMKNGVYIKDFSYLGRALKDVVYIDFTDDMVPEHKANCILVPEWKGERDDRALIDLVPFLESKF
jgi:mitochondrial import inner membrane translocase subunit TIM50